MKVNERYCSFYYQGDHDLAPVDINKERCALLIIDMQNHFCRRPEVPSQDPEAVANALAWEPFYQKIEQVVIPNNVRLLQHFRKQGLLVTQARIACQLPDGRERSLDHKATGFNELFLPHDSKAAAIVDELAPESDEIVVMKSTDSALTGTNLRLLLHNAGIEHVIVSGVFTDQCVSCTVRSLADESFKVWLIEDACMAGNEEIQQQELCILNNIYCHVINTDEALEALK